MSGVLHDIARAALPVAIILASLTATACGVIWTRVDGARAQRLARAHVEALATWCLVWATVTAVADVLAGRPFGAVELPLAICAASVLVLATVGETAPREAAPDPAPTAPAAAPTTLWADHAMH
jgi:hypothetical protein